MDRDPRAPASPGLDIIKCGLYFLIVYFWNAIIFRVTPKGEVRMKQENVNVVDLRMDKTESKSLIVGSSDGSLYRMDTDVIRRRRQVSAPVTEDELTLIEWAAGHFAMSKADFMRSVLTAYARSLHHEHVTDGVEYPGEASLRLEVLAKSGAHPTVPPPGSHLSWTARRRKQK